MSQLGNLGSRLLQAAQSSESELVNLITTQQEAIEKERPLHLHKNSGPSKPEQGPRKPHTRRGKKPIKKNDSSQERQKS